MTRRDDDDARDRLDRARDDARDRLDRARRLREAADHYDRKAREYAERDPMYADHLARRADHCRYLAADEDGGLGAR